MTHQPPVPEAAQSPYPLQPAPHSDSAPSPLRRQDGAKHGGARDDGPPLVQLIGIGAALLGSAALAAWYYRRGGTAQPQPARKSSDAKLVSAKQPYEVTYFARKHGITASEARAIIAEAGPSRARANALAAERKG